MQALRGKLYSTYKAIHDYLPHELEHYLDDADIRAKGEGYRKKQEAFIGELLEFIADEIRKGKIEEKG